MYQSFITLKGGYYLNQLEIIWESLYFFENNEYIIDWSRKDNRIILNKASWYFFNSITFRNVMSFRSFRNFNKFNHHSERSQALYTTPDISAIIHLLRTQNLAKN